MCGRYTIIAKAEEIEKRFHVEVPADYHPHFNAAPSQILPVITNERPDGLSFFRWGLIPAWAKDMKIGPNLINARAESLAEKPAFRSAFKKRRCLVVADGFYEWKRLSKKSKMPYRITFDSNTLFAFAGLWEIHHSVDGNTLHTFTIITTQANEVISKLHDRMPVILSPQTEQIWLDTNTPAEELKKLLKPFEAKKTRYYPVSPLVNSVTNDDARLILESPPADQHGNLSLFDQ